MGASSAFALDCVNASRPAPAEPTTPVAVIPHGPTIWVVDGDWWFISFDGMFADGVWDKVPPGTAASVLGLTPDQVANLGLPASTVNGNYQAGAGYGLLDNAQAPCNANRQTTSGIQAGSNRCPQTGP
jgi:hypothetical protein